MPPTPHKHAVVFYSRDGHTDRLARQLADTLAADLFPIVAGRYSGKTLGYLHGRVRQFARQAATVRADPGPFHLCKCLTLRADLDVLSGNTPSRLSGNGSKLSRNARNVRDQRRPFCARQSFFHGARPCAPSIRCDAQRAKLLGSGIDRPAGRRLLRSASFSFTHRGLGMKSTVKQPRTGTGEFPLAEGRPHLPDSAAHTT